MTQNKSSGKLDYPEIVEVLFHPRKEWGMGTPSDNFEIVRIPVAPEVEIGGRFYSAKADAPTLLYFHGNGEIVEDYDDIAGTYTHLGINFFPVDYRGYGISSGSPSVSSMLRDCHRIFEYFLNFRSKQKLNGPVVVMGRSLGSVSAIELAVTQQKEIDRLIIESGFAFIIPLLRLIGINPEIRGLQEDDGPGNFDKIQDVRLPTLIVHAELDHIIPISDGQYLFDHCPSDKKCLKIIPNADHNNIMLEGGEDYFQTIQRFILETNNKAFYKSS